MQKKNTKDIVEMKRKKLFSMGINLDNLTYEQQEKYYTEILFSDIS
jgi:hypothetical protein